MARSLHPVLRGTVLVTTLGMIAGNLVITGLPLFGRSTGAVSDRFSTLVTPAGYVFAIWGLIYIGMLAYSIAQFVEPLASDPLPDRLAWPLIVANIVNVGWLVLWHSLLIAWSVPVMLVLLTSLAWAYVLAHRERPEPSRLERWCVRAPLGLYLGWISVATIANISAALRSEGWGGWGVPPDWWAVLVLTVGAAVALAGLMREGDCVFAGVFVWAYVGIAVVSDVLVVVWAAASLAAIVATGIAISAILTRRLV